MKRLMLLGGLGYVLPVIDAAHRLGYYVITCDYLPDNIAHKFSDEYHNVSIVEQNKVLDLARKLNIDGIMSFAVDPGVVTAAFVQEKMSLPGNPYESVCILQNKAKFRKFLKNHGFNVPVAEETKTIEHAKSIISRFRFPVIIKPVDSAGSKGVTKIITESELESAFLHAIQHSVSGSVIIEEFIEKLGYSSDSDCFSVDGKLVFSSFSSQRFDLTACNPFTPAAYSWPSLMPFAGQHELECEIQRLISLLGLGTSIYNIETRIGTDGKAYIMEMSPRGGGNRISEILKLSTGTDLITACVKASVGEDIGELGPCSYNGYWAEIILHSEKSGIFQGLEVDEEVKNNIMDIDLMVKKGDRVRPFNGANDMLGTMILKSDNARRIDAILATQSSWLKILVK